MINDDHSVGPNLRTTLAPLSVADDVFRLFAQHTRDVFWVTDPSGEKVHYVSPAYEEVFGRSRESLYRDMMSWLLAIHVDDRERILQEVSNGIANGQAREIEYRIVRPDATIRCMLDRAFPVRNAQGEVEALVGVAEDITQRKKAESLHLENESRLNALVGSIDEIVLEFDGGGTFLNIWAENENLLIRPRDELLGKRIVDVFPEGESRRFGETFKRVLTTGAAEEIEYRLDVPSGRRWFLARVNRIASSDGSRNTICVLVRDITGRKSAEENLKISEEKFSKAFQASPDAISLCTLAEGRFIEVNDSFLQLTGYAKEEVTGRSGLDLGMWIVPKEREQYVALLKRDGQVRDLELRLTMKSGAMRTILASAHTTELGQTACVINILRDITERKALEEQLRQAQKMEAVGRLAGGVAHDFNNLLVGILGYSDLLNKKLADDSPLKRMAGEISAAALRARDLTSRLLALSRRQVLQLKVLDFNAVVRQAGRLLEPSMGEDIRIELRLDSKLGSVKADAAQLEQVILNLALNARDAMPHGGALSLETCNAQVDAALARHDPGLIPGSYVRLRVTDTGRGIPPGDMPRIFEPFFTTKESGDGSGLGLSTVYGIVKQSGGCVTVSSAPGHGSVFEVYLPRVNETPEAATPAAKPGLRRGGTETILLVEDEPIVRSLTRELLEEAGYRIFFASDGTEAMQQAVAIDEPIHLVITDVVMPEMSGPELANRLRKLRPETRMLYMSGYTDDEILCRKGLAENSAFIQKPFTPEQFPRKVRETLDAKPKSGQ
jgi:two-component system cell cycle sensor histidine kinase/response regulator CckA